jgi:hypothetical protein
MPLGADAGRSRTNALAGCLLAMIFSGPAVAEVKSVATNGFAVADTQMIRAPPERVYAALGEIGRWWSSAHTFSGDAANLSLERGYLRGGMAEWASKIDKVLDEQLGRLKRYVEGKPLD